MIENERVWAEIDLDRIGENVSIIRKLVPDKAEIMAIVKADGYGHGASECAQTALLKGAKSLGVAILEEGISLRESGIKEPVLILGYTPLCKLSDVVKYGLSQTIFRREMACELSRKATEFKREAHVHIKIDTGMGRLGFMPSDETVNEIADIAGLPGICIDGIYSHLADADNLHSAFSINQFDRFTEFTAKLKARGLSNVKCHISNSASIIRFPEMAMDIVRPGIIMYGLSPSHGTDISQMGFKPVMSLKSKVSYVKTVEAGNSIGYGRTFFTERKTLVATVPVGYADGYMRGLSNKGKVIINGCYAPVIGNICMDQFMVDATGIEGVKEETEVILIGESGDKAIRADDLALTLNTVNYEVVSAISKRVPRCYIKNGAIIKIVRL